MNIDRFWQIIDSVHVTSGGDMDRKCELLKKELLVIEENELRDFLNHFDSTDAAAYTWSLWGAAYVMRGGCSDDSFSDFRATLISQGREVYERAVSDPESLVELDFDDEDDACYEGFQYVMGDVAKEVLGNIPKRTISLPADPTGTEWDEDTVDQLYPRLAAQYSGEMEGGDEPISLGKPWWKFW